MVLFLMGILMSFSKLLYSNNMMTSLVSIEMIMSNLLMLMLIVGDFSTQTNTLILVMCLVVCEGTIGLSILSSINKIQSNKFLFKFNSTIK